MLFYLNAVENTSLGNAFLFTSPVNSCGFTFRLCAFVVFTPIFKEKRDYLFN